MKPVQSWSCWRTQDTPVLFTNMSFPSTLTESSLASHYPKVAGCSSNLFAVNRLSSKSNGIWFRIGFISKPVNAALWTQCALQHPSRIWMVPPQVGSPDTACWDSSAVLSNCSAEMPSVYDPLLTLSDSLGIACILMELLEVVRWTASLSRFISAESVFNSQLIIIQTPDLHRTRNIQVVSYLVATHLQKKKKKTSCIIQR